MSDRLRALQEKKNSLWKRQEELILRINSDEGTEEDRQNFDALHKELVGIDQDMQRVRQFEERQREQAASQPVTAGKQDAGELPNTKDEARATATARRDALNRWVRGQETAEDRQHLQFVQDGPRVGIRIRLSESRAGYQGAGAANLGLETVFDEPGRAIENAMLAFGGMRTVATVLRTGTGADLPIPTSNDTGNKGVLLGEGTQETTVTDIATASITMKAYKFSSDIVKASLEFVQDTSLDAFGWIASRLGERLARAHNFQFTKGSNSSAPYGVLWGSAIGATAAAAAAVSRTDILNLIHSVDPSYRTGPNVRLMFNDSTLKALKLLAVGSSDNRPLWQPGMAMREPDTVEGFRYVINQDFDSIAAGKHSMVFGDFSKYLIRDVMDINLFRFDEKYMDYGLYGFIAFTRNDGRILDAGTKPLKYLRHPAS